MQKTWSLLRFAVKMWGLYFRFMGTAWQHDNSLRNPRAFCSLCFTVWGLFTSMVMDFALEKGTSSNVTSVRLLRLSAWNNFSSWFNAKTALKGIVEAVQQEIKRFCDFTPEIYTR
jgi:hypothetical protein